MKTSEKLSEFLKFIRECKKEYETNIEYIDVEDKKTQDLLHKLEFNTLTREEKSKICTKLQRVRRTRREYKDKNECVERLVKYFEEPLHISMIHDLEEILGKIRKTEERQENECRNYVPRVLTEESDYFE